MVFGVFWVWWFLFLILNFYVWLFFVYFCVIFSSLSLQNKNKVIEFIIFVFFLPYNLCCRYNIFFWAILFLDQVFYEFFGNCFVAALSHTFACQFVFAITTAIAAVVFVVYVYIYKYSVFSPICAESRFCYLLYKLVYLMCVDIFFLYCYNLFILGVLKSFFFAWPKLTPHLRAANKVFLTSINGRRFSGLTPVLATLIFFWYFPLLCSCCVLYVSICFYFSPQQHAAVYCYLCGVQQGLRGVYDNIRCDLQCYFKNFTSRDYFFLIFKVCLFLLLVFISLFWYQIFMIFWRRHFVKGKRVWLEN